MNEKQKKETYKMLLKLLYTKAKSFGLDPKSDLECYFTPVMEYQKETNPHECEYMRLASSLQNSGRMRNSIKFNDDEDRTQFEIIKEVLCNFDYKKVLEKYTNEEQLYEEFKNKGISDDRGEESDRTNWKKYAKGLYQGAQFLAGEKKDLLQKAYNLNGSKEIDKSCKEYINKISKEIYGLGFALTCDWLKECGCVWLAKPDVHIVDIYKRIKGINKKKNVNDYEVIKYMFDWANELKSVDAGMTAYKLDKIIWLICADNFYLHKDKMINKKRILKEIDIIKSK